MSEILDKTGQVDVIFTDLSKAFDKLDHGILLSKLRSIGFDNTLLQLLQSYLSNRKFFVSYNGYTSIKNTAKSGVPQGSNLGPLLFLLFINDLPNSLFCETLMYADDVKIFSTINSYNDCLTLQFNLSVLHEWCITNRLKLNIDKCKIVTFTRKIHKSCIIIV